MELLLWEKLILLQAPPEGVAPDPQFPGRLGLVAAVPFQGGEDMVPLELLEGGFTSSPSLRESETQGEILFRNER
jgi:hypothetical protein